MSKFRVIITEIDGDLTIEIQDFETSTKYTTIKQELPDIFPVMSVGWMCEFIIKKLKPGYRKIVKDETRNKETNKRL